MNIDLRIFQVETFKTREFGWMGLEELKSYGLEVDRKNYELVFIGATHFGQGKEWEKLEQLYHDFNQNHPKYYAGRSMSMGDVVQLGEKYFYCDKIGFTQIENF